MYSAHMHMAYVTLIFFCGCRNENSQT